ncbi:hypothetical protein VKT23_006257 [Stygiomarasmius scandens]|uniref:HMG box domain-containing protein n=1 Tax=Marasmiellus scandens TaxID=2682957 RepID=A0ABR1JTK6_9AGAR
MARSQKSVQKLSNFERLLNAARTQATSTRKPWRYRTKRPAIKLTYQQKKHKKDLRDAEKQSLRDELQQTFQLIQQRAEQMREKFGKHSVQWYLDQIMQTHRMKEQRRKLSHYDAFVSMEMKARNANTSEDTARKRLPEVMADIAAKWKTLSAEEKKSSTEEVLKELEANRENKELASHNVAISAYHDTRTTLEDVKLALQRLNARTGVEAVILCVRSNTDHFNPPEAWVTSDHISTFFNSAFKTTPIDIANRLEGYCISGIEGVARNYAQETVAMKADLVKLIADKLQETAGKTKIARMYYKNFEKHITAKYGIRVMNWPLEKFVCPSDLTSRAEVEVLKHAWMSGATYFYKMTSAEFEEWDEKRFEDAMASSTPTVEHPSSNSPDNECTQTPAPPPMMPDFQTLASTSPVHPASGNPDQPITMFTNPSVIDPQLLGSTNQPVPTPTSTAHAFPQVYRAPEPTTAVQAPKRGKRALGTVNFVHTEAVTGLDGSVVLQKQGKAAKKRRGDAEVAGQSRRKGKKRRLEGNT